MTTQSADPFNEYSLSIEQIDNVIKNGFIEINPTFISQKAEELYVLPERRNKLVDPAWEYKMETLGTLIQETCN
jgi:hypothetical protein